MEGTWTKKACLQLAEKFGVLAGSVISGYLFFGSISYVTNVIRYHNPFYTMIGSGSTEMITSQLPDAFGPLSNIGRFVCSLFSKVSNEAGSAQVNVELKLPFFYFPEEFIPAQTCDTRTAGWGIFFSGIFLLSVGYIAINLVLNHTKFSRFKKILLLMFGIMVFALIFVPGLSWARYSVGLCYIPAIALTLLFRESNAFSKSTNRFYSLSGAILILLFLNSVPALLKDLHIIQNYPTIKLELETIKQQSETNHLEIGYVEAGFDFCGRFFNILDEGISDFEYKDQIAGNAVRVFPECQLVYSCISEEKLSDYLSELDLTKSLVLIAAKDDASNAITENVIGSMKNLGLAFDMKNAFRFSYVAVIDGSAVYEEKSVQKVDYTAMYDDISVSIQSSGYNEENGYSIGSILVNGIEYSKGQRGLNIVVCDKRSGIVTDSIYVDLYANDFVRR